MEDEVENGTFTPVNPRRRLSCLTGGYAMAGLQTLLLGHPLDLEAHFFVWCVARDAPFCLHCIAVSHSAQPAQAHAHAGPMRLMVRDCNGLL